MSEKLRDMQINLLLTKSRIDLLQVEAIDDQDDIIGKQIKIYARGWKFRFRLYRVPWRYKSGRLYNTSRFLLWRSVVKNSACGFKMQKNQPNTPSVF